MTGMLKCQVNGMHAHGYFFVSLCSASLESPVFDYDLTVYKGESRESAKLCHIRTIDIARVSYWDGVDVAHFGPGGNVVEISHVEFCAGSQMIRFGIAENGLQFVVV